MAEITPLGHPFNKTPRKQSAKTCVHKFIVIFTRAQSMRPTSVFDPARRRLCKQRGAMHTHNTLQHIICISVPE